MPVSARARLPVRSASRPSSLSTRPAVPCSVASLTADRTWPRIWSSPTTIESSPVATASSSQIAVTPAWNLSTSAYTSTRLQVETTKASATGSACTTSRSSLVRVSPLTAARSKAATGALLWLRPTTSTLTCSPPSLWPLVPGSPEVLNARRRSWRSRRGRGPGRRPALRMEGEDLQLDRQVDLPHVYPFRHAQHERSEVEDARDASRDEPVADGLRGPGGGGDHADRDLVPGHHGLEFVDMPDGQPRDPAAHDSRVAVEHGGDREAAGDETSVIGQGPAEVARAHDDHRPVLHQAERPGHLVDEVVDVVADPPDPVGAEVGQVLAQLGRVDARGGRELLAGHGADAALGQAVERAQVHRQPRHGGLGYPVGLAANLGMVLAICADPLVHLDLAAGS